MPATDAAALPLFVYGSLRCGQHAHRRHCRTLLASTPAGLWARHRWLPSGYPIITLPERAVLAAASVDPGRDAELAARLAVPADWTRRPMGDWQQIEGELLLLGHPRRGLPAIDRYEDCRPGSCGPYRRVLTWVATTAGAALAWTYCSHDRRRGQAPSPW